LSEGADARPAFAPGPHAIEAYGAGGFGFAGMTHVGSIIATPRGVRALDVAGIDDLDEARLAPLLADHAADPAAFEFVCIGAGARMARLPPAAGQALRARGLRFEVMATGPALRVYNIMLGERRRVAALLIAAP